MIDFFLADSDATELLGQWLAATRPPQALVELRGDLGPANPPRPAHCCARWVSGRHPQPDLHPGRALSAGRRWRGRHLDLYRIGQAGELDFLGLDEGSAVLWLVEWPERGAGALPPTDLVVALEIEDKGVAFVSLAPATQGMNG